MHILCPAFQAEPYLLIYYNSKQAFLKATPPSKYARVSK